METTDVLIVGAGPSGLMTALSLGKYDIRTTIVERRQLGTMYGNADTIQPGTIEMLQMFGLRERFMKESIPVFAYAAYSTDEETGLLERHPQGPNVNVSDARYPYELAMSIEQIESVLRDAAIEYGVKIEQPWIPTSLVVSRSSFDGVDNYPIEARGLVDDYPIEVTIERSAGSPTNETSSGALSSDHRTIRAKYVVGCDGAHSWVRDAAGLHMEKAERDDQAVNWGVVTFTPETDFPDTMVKAVIATPVCGMISWMPRPDGRGRLYVPLSSKFDTRSCTTEVFLEAIQSVIDDALKPWTMKVAQCDWISAYKVVQSVADHFSAHNNRVFIAGDAAYTHSAKTGQGANAAMKDAFNLGWKLAFVLRGWAKPSLLNTYEEERRAYAQDLIALDKEIARAIEGGGHHSRYRRIWDEKNRFISGVGVVCDSALTPSPKPSTLALRLLPGERLPPATILRLADWRPSNVHDILAADCTFKLILFPGELRASYDNVATFVEALGARLGKRGALVRVAAVFSDMKVWAHWTDAPACLHHDPFAIFVDDAGSSETSGLDASPNNVYQAYEIAPEGCALLVRPDAHISLVCPATEAGAHTITEFLLTL